MRTPSALYTVLMAFGVLRMDLRSARSELPRSVSSTASHCTDRGSRWFSLLMPQFTGFHGFGNEKISERLVRWGTRWYEALTGTSAGMRDSAWLISASFAGATRGQLPV